jgi:hypothetical protein
MKNTSSIRTVCALFSHRKCARRQAFLFAFDFALREDSSTRSLCQKVQMKLCLDAIASTVYTLGFRPAKRKSMPNRSRATRLDCRRPSTRLPVSISLSLSLLPTTGSRFSSDKSAFARSKAISFFLFRETVAFICRVPLHFRSDIRFVILSLAIFVSVIPLSLSLSLSLSYALGITRQISI